MVGSTLGIVGQTMWTPCELNSALPLYRSIAHALERDISRGLLEPGERLPTHRDLARALEVNVMTVTRAYAVAGQRGLVTGEVGRGTFVRGRKRSAPVALPRPAPETTLVDLGYHRPNPDPDLFDFEGVLADLARGRGRELLLSGNEPRGLVAHRTAGAEWIRKHGLAADVDRVVVTSGAQHALTVALSALCGPGDVVLTEALTDPAAGAVSAALRLRLEGVALDGEGLLPDAFEAACRKLAPKALLCAPTIHDPTGTVLGAERRRALAEIARHFGVSIVENATNAFLAEDAPPPLASFAPERSYYLLGLANSVVPGLRIGFLLAPAVTGPTGIAVERLASILASLTGVAGLTWAAAPLMAELAARWIRDGTAEGVGSAVRGECAMRRKLFDRVLGVPVDAHATSSILWMELSRGWSADAIVREARHHGVALTPPDPFRVQGHAEDAKKDGLRISLATPSTRGEVEKALRILSGILDCTPGSERLGRLPRARRHAGPF